MGGESDGGTIFKITPTGDLTTLYSLYGGPIASPILGGDGNLYGTAYYSPGFAYKITPSGAYTLLAPLPYFPFAPLFYGTNGSFYGTTYAGGNAGTCFEGCGTIFRMTPGGTVTTLHNFDGPHGEQPNGGVVEGSDGNLYGTTLRGGSDDKGTVFRLSAKGFTVLKNFRGLNGSEPFVGVIQATDGNLYGVTAGGGTLGNGVFFQITSAGYSVLYNFHKALGQYPVSQLTQHTNGKLYGMTSSGGAFDYGVVYSVDLGLPPFAGLVSTAGKVGQTGGILGQGFTGTTSVLLNGTPASFTVVSDTYIRATVPAGATTGYVTVTTPSGTLTSNVPFQVIP